MHLKTSKNLKYLSFIIFKNSPIQIFDLIFFQNFKNYQKHLQNIQLKTDKFFYT